MIIDANDRTQPFARYLRVYTEAGELLSMCLAIDTETKTATVYTRDDKGRLVRSNDAPVSSDVPYERLAWAPATPLQTATRWHWRFPVELPPVEGLEVG